MTENSPVCLSDESALQAQAPSVPTEQVTASAAKFCNVCHGYVPTTDWNPPSGFAHEPTHCECVYYAPFGTYTKPVENSPSPALGGYDPKANAQSPLSGSQALPSASTTNIRALPDTAGEAEPVAWVQPEALFYITAGVEGSYRLAAGMCSEYTEPLYSEATVQALQKREAGLREALKQAARFIDDYFVCESAQDDAALERVSEIIAQALGDQT